MAFFLFFCGRHIAACKQINIEDILSGKGEKVVTVGSDVLARLASGENVLEMAPVATDNDESSTDEEVTTGGDASGADDDDPSDPSESDSASSRTP